MAKHNIVRAVGLTLACASLGFVGCRSKEKDAANREKVREAMVAAVQMADRGQVEPAIERLEDLVDDHPKLVAPRLNLGIALRAAGRMDDALEALEGASKIAPEDWDIAAERATVLFGMSRVDEGFKLLEGIPRGQGRMVARLKQEPVWRPLADHDRMRALREKHGIGEHGLADTSERTLEEIDRQRRSYPKLTPVKPRFPEKVAPQERPRKTP